MRFLLVGLALLVPTAAPAQSLKDARTALQRGNYGEAEEDYALLLKDADRLVPASVGISQALQAQGKDGLPAIETALKKQPKDAELLARKAELLYDRGEWESALAAANSAIKIKSDSFLARWIVAQIYRDQGEWPKANEELKWFIQVYNKASDDDREIKDPETLRIIGLAQLERARYRHQPEEYNDVFNVFWSDVLKTDKLYWQIEFEKGRIALDKHNKKLASAAFDEALKINPRATEVFALRGWASFGQMEMKEADLAADQALAINPNSIDALRLKAAVHLFSNENDLALKLLEVARKQNPRNEETLAQIAAVHYVEKKTKEFDAIVAEVAKFNPKSWKFYAEVGEQLDHRKLWHDSEAFFKKAADAEPALPEGNEGLGMLYMRLGKEKEARTSLELAFEADPFNVRVDNSLKVLDHLKKYKTIETPHYILKFDPDNDAILARFVLNYLESFHDELGKKFDYHPEKPFLIEIFNKHEMFSGRVIALPDLHTIGACTGRMMAMVSTHDRSKVIRRPFNWVRVLRHEVVHLYNLDQTKFQIPHWFTEGLAVTLEGKTPPPSWNYLLAEKLRGNDLLNLDNILLGFVRPRSPEQWQQAYMQSQLYVTYLTKTHGEPAIGKLLQAYADGFDTDGALPKAIGVSKAEFEKGYRAFLEDRVKNLPIPPEKDRRTLKELREEYKKNPNDGDVCALLAEKHWLIGDTVKAKQFANEALIAKPNHPIAAYVKAEALVSEKRPELAMGVLVSAVDANPDSTRPLKALASLQIQSKNLTSAAETLEKGRKLEPFETFWLMALAKVYIETKDNDRLADILKSVAEADPDDLVSRKKLAERYDKLGMHAEAEKYAWETLEIDVKDAEAARILCDALAAQGKNEKLKLVQRLLNGDG